MSQSTIGVLPHSLQQSGHADIGVQPHTQAFPSQCLSLVVATGAQKPSVAS